MDQEMNVIRPCIRWAFNAKQWNPTREQFIQAIRCVQIEETNRIMEYKYKKDVRPTLIGRVMTRSCLKSLLNISNRDLLLDRTMRGKPIFSLPPEPGFDFNVSHHGDHVVLAVDASRKVGVDIMRTKQEMNRDVPSYFHLMRGQFSKDEWEFIRGNHDENVQMARFMRLWSLKESYVKAEGFGITVNLQKTSFTCPTAQLSTSHVVTDTTLEIEGLTMENWTFEESMIDREHCVSVAIESLDGLRGGSSNIFQWKSFPEIIANLQTLDSMNNERAEELWEEYVSKSENPNS